MWKKIILSLSLVGFLVGCPNNNKLNPDKIPTWEQCTKASCWNGSNAQQRMMNILSQNMPEAKFLQYMNWMKGRGCNTAHLIIANKGDGEDGGYCIYGNKWDWTINDEYCNIMRNRIKILRDNGFAIVIWLFTDDSAEYANEAKKNFPKYLNDVKAQKLLDSASIVVVGLELQDYYNNSATVAALINATRSVYSGKIGTHETSGNRTFAGLSDICFYQVNPGQSASWIQAEAAKVKKATGKPVNFFEMERNPSNSKCIAAMNGGAYAVGNW